VLVVDVVDDIIDVVVVDVVDVVVVAAFAEVVNTTFLILLELNALLTKESTITADDSFTFSSVSAVTIGLLV
jgi:hypothetical protein